MRFLRQCDLFRVVQDNESHLTPATSQGVATTIVTICILSVLFISEVHTYLSGHTSCHITPSAFRNYLDADKQRELDTLHFSISLPYIPCHRIATEVFSQWKRNAQMQRDTNVALYHIPRGSFETMVSSKYAPGEALSEVEQGCFVKGTSPIASTPSSFHIILQDFTFTDMKKYRPDFKIHHFSAGRAYDWGIPQMRQETLQPMSDLALSYNLSEPYFYQFFLQLIPTTVESAGQDDRFGYQYTSFHSMLRTNGQGRAPGLYFSYKFSPFSMECAVQYDTVSHFMVNLCAVVGGVYTVAGMVEAALEWFARERRLKETSARNRQTAKALNGA